MHSRSLTARLSFARRYARGAVMDRHAASRCVAPAPHRPDPATWPDDRLTVAWLGHATVLLNVSAARWLLTDPALEQRHRPGPRAGQGGAAAADRARAPRARAAAARRASALARPHGSHRPGHPPAQSDAGVAGVVQPGNGDLVRRFRSVRRARLGRDHHGRPTWKSSRSRCATGAPGWSPTGTGDMAAICSGRTAAPCSSPATPPTPTCSPRCAARGPIDLAILPIGAYDPWIANHASPEEAWRMFQALGADLRAPHPPLDLPAEPRAAGGAGAPPSRRRGRGALARGAHRGRPDLDAPRGRLIAGGGGGGEIW